MVSSCNVSNNDDDIKLSTSPDKLIIENNLSVKIYYNIIDYSDVPLFDWAPSNDDKFSIKAGDSKKIKFGDIFTTKERSLKNGDKVEFNWWTDKYLEKSYPEKLDGMGKTYGTKRKIL